MRRQAMGSPDVDHALAEMRRALTPYVMRDWTVLAGGLAWTCRQTAAHVAHDLLAYAGQLTARPAGAYLPFDLTVRPDATPQDVLDVVAASGGLLSSALRAADPQARAWHWGPTDATGFAALGVNEILLHTYDITEGLQVAWQPPPALCAAVLHRLFPDAPAGNPAEVLLWCTGRAALGDRPRRTSWTLTAAVEEKTDAMSLSTADRLAIHELIARHGHLMDGGEWERLDELFTADVVYDVSAFGAGELHGHAAIRDAALALGNRNPVAHHVTNVVVTEEGDQVRVRSKGIGINTDGSLGSVVYDDVVRHEPAGWRIAHRRVTLRRTPLQP